MQPIFSYLAYLLRYDRARPMNTPESKKKIQMGGWVGGCGLFDSLIES